MTRSRLATLLAFAAALLLAASTLDIFDPPPTDRMRRVFPAMEQLRVTDYRSQDWCRNIVYTRGAFSETTHPTTCNLFDDTPRDFDTDAQRDFDAFAEELRQAGVAIDWLDAEYGSGGTLVRASFESATIGGYRGYLYEPGYALPGDDYKIRYLPIDHDWYLREEEA